MAKDNIKELVQPLIGLKVSRVWRGFGSALFVELGKLSRKAYKLKSGKRKSYLIGQQSIFVGYSWRVERSKSIYFGSWNTQRLIDNRLPKLEGRVVESIIFVGRLPEIYIKLSDGLWIHSFDISSSYHHQPSWYITLRNKQPLEFIRSCYGKLKKEISDKMK
jgi:hypothetical protein